ncbi:hypothetical protein AMECASPLE_039679 [Ameca splendens]|uniref:Uncharacterized protein n=1 Tax=Ameca splendens TaxID=208324 RepID=A0ABV0ZJD5_9TELE
MAAKLGRKRQSPVWDYFEFDCILDTSKYLVVEQDQICGQFLKGKNPTNLKVHLKSSNKRANLAYLEKVKEHAQSSSAGSEGKPKQSSEMHPETTPEKH